MSDDKVDQKGRCVCGAVEYHVQGDLLFCFLCHCRACSWALSVSPVHLVGVKATMEYTKGQDKVVITKGLGKMILGRCKDCLVPLYQKPEDAPFVALFPPAFHIGGEDSLDQKLPDKYHPKCHMNYENRAMDANDSLPKYKTGPPNNQMNNDGSLIQP
ncbi:Glutathione-dependent formaldehyde-activating enzyme [Seminavis robusta]|uniref:Glutathione-dependent formaldehyde-activating enzyme n=1 Tax=Seminavis robusta TaxID=568900 RepID=A0A9N8DHJ5_9STRA|nr:Glutathione-dependent formaldehyde-activating enzyme [Seminavis robusta]|eukprot:Sro146_g067650.1 Glutathione-dependent formaldehyde-activating enzyme (158) ;mRNA; r:78162-78635